MSFISSQGSDTFTALTDMDDGPTLSQLLTLNVEVGRLSLAREKAQVNCTVVALTSILDSKVLAEFNTNIDKALADTDVLSASKSAEKARFSNTEKRAAGVSGDNDSRKSTGINRTMTELNKLNALMGR